MQGLGFGVKCYGRRILGSGFRVQGLELGVEGVGLKFKLKV